LITVLISILSNQFAKYNARDQYHFLFGTLPPPLLHLSITNHGCVAYACVESITSDHTFDFYPPINLLQLLFLRPLRLFLPSRHPFLQTTKFTLFRITHAPFVLFVTLFEQIFYSKAAGLRGHALGAGLLRPPSSRSESVKVAANRASFYSQLATGQGKWDVETVHSVEEQRGGSAAMVGGGEVGEIKARLGKLEDEVVAIREMVKEILSKL